MKLAPSGLGAEPKKVALLAGILLLGVVGDLDWRTARTRRSRLR